MKKYWVFNASLNLVLAFILIAGDIVFFTAGRDLPFLWTYTTVLTLLIAFFLYTGLIVTLRYKRCMKNGVSGYAQVVELKKNKKNYSLVLEHATDDGECIRSFNYISNEEAARLKNGEIVPARIYSNFACLDSGNLDN